MKKTLSLLFSIILIGCLTAIPVSAKTTLTAPNVSVSSSVNKATVKISKVKSAKKYEIYMKKGSGGWKKVKITSSKSFTKSSLSGGQKYYFKVRAVNATGKGKFSKVKSVTVKKPAKKVVTYSATVYITDTGEKYHSSGCSSLRKSKHAISKSSAISQGYSPCSRCHP